MGLLRLGFEIAMPRYDYVCRVCGRRFERRQGFDDRPVVFCPAGHENVRRLPSHPAIHFKGPGFYITDSKGADHSSAR
jgi:putative FmdB family regulatory protein